MSTTDIADDTIPVFPNCDGANINTRIETDDYACYNCGEVFEEAE